MTAGDDRTARIWRTADGAPVHVLRHPHTVVVATFDPAARRLATISGGQVRIFDVASGSELVRLPEGGVTSVAFSPDGTLLATGSTDHKAKLWRAGTGALYAPPFDHQRASVVDVAFTQLGDRLVTAGSDGSARVWGVTDRPGQRIAVIGRQLGPITSIALSPAEREEPAANVGSDREPRRHREGVEVRGRAVGDLARAHGAAHDGGVQPQRSTRRNR